ncbi:MAG: hypothetical protein ACFFBL_09815, partial [Promethearchaeota archaeon]
YSYNDTYFFNLIRQKKSETNRLGDLCRWLLERKPLKLVDYDRVYGLGESADTRISPLWFPSTFTSVAEEAGIPPEHIFRTKQNRAFVDLKGDLIHIYYEDLDEAIPLSTLKESALCDLVGKSYFEDRIYTYPDFADAVEKAIYNHVGKRRSPQVSG